MQCKGSISALSSIGWGAGLQSGRLVQGKGSISAQGLNKGKIK